MMRFPVFLITSVCVLFFISCNDDNNATISEETSDPKFFYAGYTYSDKYSSAQKWAVYAINDSLITLSEINRSDAKAIYSNGKDVFIAGYQHNGTSNKRITLWKNKDISYLSAAAINNTATAVYVNQGKIYVAGTEYENNLPYQRLWVNGELKVNSGAMGFSRISTITTYNGDYYLAGQFAQAATTWYGDTMKTINVAPSEATYIKATDSEVISMGYSGLNINEDALKVWKENEAIFSHPLGERIERALTTMNGNDYYFVTIGFSGNLSTAKVFKNKTLLYELAAGEDVEAVAIQIYKNTVYILGNIIRNGQSTPTLWVNGTPQTLFPNKTNLFLNHFYIR